MPKQNTEKLKPQQMRREPGTEVVWFLERFVPDHCVNCGHDFKGSDFNYVSITREGRRYPISNGMHRVAVCKHCGRSTAMVMIEEMCAFSASAARRLTKQRRSTRVWKNRTDKAGVLFYRERGRVIYPLGIGLGLK